MGKPVFLPGRYRHFKGKYYELLCSAKHSETQEDLVIYRALYGEGGVWARPAAMWNELVQGVGAPERRFTFVGGGELPEVTIRPERPEEFGQIREFVQEAFSTAAVADGDEQGFVDMIRQSGAYVPALSLVAERDGNICGHIMLSRVKISEKPVEGLLIVAPVSVALDLRGKGLGSALMQAALSAARLRGDFGVILVGNPAYYHRFGFRDAKEYGLTAKQSGFPDSVFMALPLNGTWPPEMTGEIDLEKPY